MAQLTNNLKDFIIGLAHVGHVVTDMDAALANFKRVYGVTDDDIRIPANPPGVEVMTNFAFVTVGGTEFELIEPVSEYFKELLLAMPSGMAGINHVAYLVSDIEAAVAALEKVGIVPGHVTPNGVVDFGEKKLCYLDPNSTGDLLIELIEINSAS
ncbi:VOC family protein [Oceanicoccus sp. KOV_DT_Chl]|uniref:VOC family protein n=1 Tax=Oceanicoccus sp. KOV_DT_Chl TaxID=1904639 RepID=UPI00135801B3|nr:VOC family protein [Oceanicoccus sp. KOV_DT_Chl]